MPDPFPTVSCDHVRLSALRLLCVRGWTYLSPSACLEKRRSMDEVILESTLLDVLKAKRVSHGERTFALSPNNIATVMRTINDATKQADLQTANEALYQIIKTGISLSQSTPDGDPFTFRVFLIDWHNQKANRFEVSDRFACCSAHGTHIQTPDIVCFINGLPLAVIEARLPETHHDETAMIAAGIRRHWQNQQHGEIPRLYVFAQLLLSIDQTDGRYGTTHTPAKFWASWREQEFDAAKLFGIKNRTLPMETQSALLQDYALVQRNEFRRQWAQAMQCSAQDQLLIGLLSPERILAFLPSFILFDRQGKTTRKLVARHQQFFAARALIARIVRRNADGQREGGVVWHTSGSGKSHTMVFLNNLLLQHDELKECRVLVVTDRIDLEHQLADNFEAGGALGARIAGRNETEKPRANSGGDLAKWISQDGRRIKFVLIQKFKQIKATLCNHPSANMIVLIDEAHRSQNGELHQKMRQLFKRAAFIAFTGTPLLKQEKTVQQFGPILHTYTMQRAINDGAVLPLLYEERIPALRIDAAATDDWFESILPRLSQQDKTNLQNQLTKTANLCGAEKRIELIALDIALHFSGNIKMQGQGLKGQIATASKRDAIRYKKYLDMSGLVHSAVIMSAPGNAEGEDYEDATAPEAQAQEIQDWWRQHVGADQLAYEREVLRRFAAKHAGAGERGCDLLIVVDRLLTGFDEPANAVLYIDKPLKNHSLIQAIARVNRLHGAKRFGLLVDYRGILRPLDSALRSYQELEADSGYDAADIQGLYRSIGSEYRRLPAYHSALLNLFEDLDGTDKFERYRYGLMPHFAEDGQGGDYDCHQKRREDFYAALSDFASGLQLALSSRDFFEDKGCSEETIQGYKNDLVFFSALHQVAQRDAMEPRDDIRIAAQVRHLIDKLVQGVEMRQTLPPRLLVPASAAEPNIWSSWSKEKIANEAYFIRNRLKTTIGHTLASDPYAQRQWGKLLEQTIAKANALGEQSGQDGQPLEQYQLFKALEQQVADGALDGIPEDAFNRQPNARVYYGIFRLVLGDAHFEAASPSELEHYAALAKEIDYVVGKLLAESTAVPRGVESKIRSKLVPILFQPLGEKHTQVINKVVEVCHIGIRRLNNRHDGNFYD